MRVLCYLSTFIMMLSVMVYANPLEVGTIVDFHFPMQDDKITGIVGGSIYGDGKLRGRVGVIIIERPKKSGQEGLGGDIYWMNPDQVTLSNMKYTVTAEELAARFLKLKQSRRTRLIEKGRRQPQNQPPASPGKTPRRKQVHPDPRPGSPPPHLPQRSPPPHNMPHQVHSPSHPHHNMPYPGPAPPHGGTVWHEAPQNQHQTAPLQKPPSVTDAYRRLDDPVDFSR